MINDKDCIYSIETVESIIADPNSSWKNLFKEIIISMIASNKNELLWYANFLSRCEYEFHFNESFTSAVYFNGKNFVITINPVILGLLSKDEIIAILKHSAGHIIYHHFSRGKYQDNVDKEIIEIAKDIVINGSKDVPYIQDLPRTGSYKNSPIGAFFYQTLSEKYGIKSYEIGRKFEYYIELILAVQEEESLKECANNLMDEITNEDNIDIGSTGEKSEITELDDNKQNDTNNEVNPESTNSQTTDESNGSFDDKETGSLSQKTLEALQNGECFIDNHSYGEQLQENVGLDDSLLNSFTDIILSEMIDDSTDFARGFTPSEAIDARNAIEKRKSHKDWRKIFNKKMRNFFTNSMRYREINKSRQHPIYPDDFDLYGYSPGKKPKLGVVLDVSGSVDDKLLVALMSEIQSIQRKYSIKSVTLVQVDAEIKSIENFKVHDNFVVRHGGGGTIMEPGFNALLRQSSREIPDMIICATDGDIEKEFVHVNLPNNIQVIWLINKGARLLFDTHKYTKHQMHVIEFSL